MNEKPLIGIPMGDPAGIGPEIVVKTLASKEAHQYGRMVVVGDRRILEEAAAFSNVELEIRVIDDVSEAVHQEGILNLIQRGELDYKTFKPGLIQGQCGKAAFEYIKTATELTLANKLNALATTPINKESLKAGEINYIGHTEILADLTGTADPLTMFQVKELRVFFLTRHMSLVNAIQSLTPARICDYAIRCTEALNRLGLKNPRLAVAGINPHCGEHGLFGHEDDDVLAPGVEMARKAGVNIVGPKPADSVFHFALEGAYDAVLSPITIRDISRPRWWTSTVRYPLPTACRF